MGRTDVSYEMWLDETFGRAVTGDSYPQFVQPDDWPEPVCDELVVQHLTRLFENSEESLRFYSDRQIACGFWELGPGDAHCVHNRNIPIEARVRLIASVETFFRDFFDRKCIPKLSHLDKQSTEPLNGICYMWWEVICMGGAKDDPDAERLNLRELDVMESALQLPNLACKEAALHGLGHLVHRSDRVLSIIDGFLEGAADLDPDLLQYARAARTGCIQ